MDERDRDALDRARAGDRDAFRELVERHAHGVFRLSFRLTGNEEDAEDVVQETFFKAHRALGRFDDRAGFATWVHRIATNTALDLLRRRKRLDGPQGVESDAIPSRAVSPEDGVLGAEVGRHLKAAMGRLTTSERTALVLRHFEGRHIDEIAAALDVSAGAARSCIFRAVAKLREELRPFVQRTAGGRA